MALTQITTNGIKDGTITGADLTTNVDLVDNQKLRLGTGNDLQIYHDGSNSYISETGTGALIIDAPNTIFQDGKKVVLGTGSDFQLYHDGSHTYAKNATGNLRFDADALRLRSYTGNENYIKADVNGAVELYYDNSKKFETTSYGTLTTGHGYWGGGSTILYSDGDALFSGASANMNWDKSDNALEFADSAKLILGSSADCQILHDGTDTFIQNKVGDLRIANNVAGDVGGDITIQAMNGEDSIKCIHDGAVELYHNNSKKFETTSDGISVSNIVQVGNTNDQGELRIGHDGSTYRANLVSNSSNSLQINADGPEQIHMHGGVIYMKPINSEISAGFVAHGAVELYYDNSKKFETTSTGVKIAGNIRVGNGSNLDIKNDNGSETLAKFINNGAVELYYDNSKKFETTSAGATVTGTLSCSSNFTASGASNVLGNTTINGGGGAGGVALTVDYSGTDVFKVSNLGKVTITGSLDMQDDDKILLGTGDDLQIDHDGSHSNIHNTGTGNLHIRGNGTDQIKIQAKSGEQSIVCSPDGDVELYHDNSKKLDTESDGVKISGVCTATHGFEIDDTATTTNQGRGILWTGFDKEGTSDVSDTAGIIHTVNQEGLTGSVLRIFSNNDDSDGIVLKGGNTTGSYGTRVVNGLQMASGGIRPTTGTSQNGIRWADDFAGGSGDQAHIQYYADGSGENTRLRIHIGNDADDDLRLEGNSIRAQGSFSKSSGSFRVPHVLPDLTKTTDLVHSFIEGPQADNIYRGKAKLVNGTVAVNIDTTNNMTEGTFVNLNRDVQCFTTNETGWTAIKGSVTDNILTITAQDNTCTDTISWMVIGERWDLAMYDPKNPMTDANGKVKTEIPNNSYNKGGDYEQDYIYENKYRVGVSDISRPLIANKEIE